MMLVKVTQCLFFLKLLIENHRFLGQRASGIWVEIKNFWLRTRSIHISVVLGMDIPVLFWHFY